MIRFLTLDEVVAEQLRQLTTYGGGQPGILNPGTLASAVEQPKATFNGNFLYADIHEMASAYLVSLVKGHAFSNGNKRIGLACALIFLFVNGTIIEATTDEVVALVFDVISGNMKREQAAEFFRSHVAIFASSLHALRIEGMETSPDLVVDAGKFVNAIFADAFAILAQ